MKIKTIVDYVPDYYDDKINKHLGEGYILEHRGLLPPDSQGKTAHYAQMVLPDPPEEPAPFNPALALHQVQTFCYSVDQNDCGTGRCPLNGWCQRLRDCADPTDWDLSEEVPF